MNYKRSRRLFELCFVIGVSMTAAGNKTSDALLAGFGSAILLAGAVQVWLIYRCPNCGAN